uniref:Uncharacterized protein n=1 Tax=Arundo donax TaxID=35708 RepID=A0A0A9FZU1_ARUDO
MLLVEWNICTTWAITASFTGISSQQTFSSAMTSGQRYQTLG